MVASYLHTLRRFSRDVRLILVVYALIGFIYLGIYAVLLNLYLFRLGYGPESIGLLNAAGALGFAVCSLPAGALGGRWGLRRLMLIGAGLWSAGLVLFPLGEFLPIALRMEWFLSTLVMSWVGGAVFFVNATPFLVAAATPEERSYVFSVNAALMPLASFAGNLIGGLLPGLFALLLGGSLNNSVPYRYSLFIADLLSTLGVLALLGTSQVRTDGTRRAEAEPSGPAPWGRIVFLSLVALLAGAGGGILLTFFTLYLDAGLHLPTALIGLLSGLGQLMGVPAALAMPALVGRWGSERTYVLGTLGIALSLLLLALVPHWAAAGLGRMGVAVLLAITGPTFMVYHQGSVAPRWRAAMSGSANMALGLSWSIMALGGGYLIARLGYSSLFSLGAGLGAAGALLFYGYTRIRKNGEAVRWPALKRYTQTIQEESVHETV